MSKDQKNMREKLERLSNSLADEIDAMTDEEFQSELEEAGEDITDIASRTRTLISNAMENIGHKKLIAARAGYEHHKSAGHDNILQWSHKRKQKLINQFSQDDNYFEQKLTMAARNEGDSEFDIDSIIEDLIELGIIDDKGNIK